MKKVFYLRSCSACTRILKTFDLSDWVLREIKTLPISEAELEEMYKLTRSYEDLFSRRSTQIKVRDLDLNALEENDYKNLLLEHYSFLKRPVFLTTDRIFIGNSKNTVESLAQYLS